MTNEEIAKAIQQSDFANGGELLPEQQKKFEVMLTEDSVLLKEARFETRDNKKGEIDKLYLGEPITQAAVEDNAPTGNEAKPKTSKLEYSTKKLVSYYDITTDSLQANIEQEGFEDTFMKVVAGRIGNDLEMLAIMGDTAITGTTPIDRLLKARNGWLKQTLASHIVDAAGGSLTKKLFARMYRQLPDAIKGDSNLRWIMPKTFEADWMDYISDRISIAGDKALEGMSPRPMGIPILGVPLMPSNKSVVIAAASPGWTKGTRYGPFVIDGSTNYLLRIGVDGVASVTITLTAGTLTTMDIARKINDRLADYIAFDAGDGSPDGTIRIQSKTTGASSAIKIATITNSANLTLGLTPGTYSGKAAAGGGTVPEGGDIWLSNPKNFISILLKKTRVYTIFEPRKDHVEVTVYNEVDYIVEALDRMVRSVNTRLRDLS